MKCPGCGGEKINSSFDTPSFIEENLQEIDYFLKMHKCEECGMYWWVRRDSHYCEHCKRYLPIPASLCSSCGYGGLFNA